MSGGPTSQPYYPSRLQSRVQQGFQCRLLVCVSVCLAVSSHFTGKTAEDISTKCLSGIQFSVSGGKYRTDFRYFRYLIVGIRYFSVSRIPTSVQVSVFQNIGYRFRISVQALYRPKTTKCDACRRCGPSSVCRPSRCSSRGHISKTVKHYILAPLILLRNSDPPPDPLEIHSDFKYKICLNINTISCSTVVIPQVLSASENKMRPQKSVIVNTNSRHQLR